MNKHQETGKIVIIYALFGCAWIYFSDSALDWLIHDPDVMTKISIFKGLLFVVCTSILLFYLIARLTEKIKQSTDALRESEERLHFLVKNSSDTPVLFFNSCLCYARKLRAPGQNNLGDLQSNADDFSRGPDLHCTVDCLAGTFKVPLTMKAGTKPWSMQQSQKSPAYTTKW